MVEKRVEFEPGARVYCALPDGTSDGPFTVSWSEGTVTFVRAAAGTMLALPTYRLHAMPALLRKRSGRRPKTRPYPADA